MDSEKIELNTKPYRTVADKDFGKRLWIENKDTIKGYLSCDKLIILTFPACSKRVSTAFFNGFFEELVEEEKKEMGYINKYFEIDNAHPGYSRINEVFQLYLEANV